MEEAIRVVDEYIKRLTELPADFRKLSNVRLERDAKIQAAVEIRRALAGTDSDFRAVS